MKYTFGLEEFDTAYDAQEGVLSYINNQLVNNNLTLVTDSDGREYNLVINVEMIPRAMHLPPTK